MCHAKPPPPYLLEMTTLLPSAERHSTIPLPRPVPPPVTKATFPSNVPGGSMGVFRAGKWLAAAVVLQLRRRLRARKRDFEDSISS